MSGKLEIKISDLEQAGKDFVNACHLAEESNDIEPRQLLTFDSLQSLLKTLTPKRLEILTFIRSQGPISIRSLSSKLHRDYKNVHTDVKVLEDCELIARKEDKAYVPWSEVIASLSLKGSTRIRPLRNKRKTNGLKKVTTAGKRKPYKKAS